MTTATAFNIEALPVTITYVAEVPSKWDDTCKTNVDQWRVELRSAAGFHSFDYFTGLGLRKKTKGSHEWLATAKPVKPSIADALHSLFLDASAADENFHDWCDTYGYSDDSIKAMNTYKQCLEVGVALRKHFTPEQRACIQAIIQEM